MQQGLKISDEICQAIIQDFIDDPTTTYMETSRKYDISRETVKNILYKAGFKLPGRRRGKGKEHTISTQERNERNGVSPREPTKLTRSL